MSELFKTNSYIYSKPGVYRVCMSIKVADKEIDFYRDHKSRNEATIFKTKFDSHMYEIARMSEEFQSEILISLARGMEEKKKTTYRRHYLS